MGNVDPLLTYTLACIYVGRIDGIVGNASAGASVIGISAMTKATHTIRLLNAIDNIRQFVVITC